jgi:hypothetical protein
MHRDTVPEALFSEGCKIQRRSWTLSSLHRFYEVRRVLLTYHSYFKHTRIFCIAPERKATPLNQVLGHCMYSWTYFFSKIALAVVVFCYFNVFLDDVSTISLDVCSDTCFVKVSTVPGLCSVQLLMIAGSPVWCISCVLKFKQRSDTLFGQYTRCHRSRGSICPIYVLVFVCQHLVKI